VALSSCDVFKKDDPSPATDPYTAANAYAPGAGATQPPANPGYPAANAYGAPQAYNPATPPGSSYSPPPNAGYSAPSYAQPYVQPSNPPAGTGYAYDTPPAAGGSGRTHTVVPGDKLSVIAKRYSVSVDAIMQANHLTNPNMIVAGKTLIIP
jgi:hypothetical protein